MTLLRVAIVAVSFIICSQEMNSSYLWEMRGAQGERSCCLHIFNVDIPNPHVPSSGFVKKDLSGILAYILRLLETDQAKQEPHYSLLLQIQRAIESMLRCRYSMIGYKQDMRVVPFYHELIAQAILKSKENKNASAGAQAKAKAAKDDFVAQHLMKLGLMTRPAKQ